MLVRILEPYFKEIQDLQILLLGDSEVVTKFLNPNLIISHTKTRNSVHSLLTNIDRILQIHPTWTIKLGWCPGIHNPSDLMSKYHKDSLKLAEHKIFRHGPADGATIEEVMEFQYQMINKEGATYKPLDTMKNNTNSDEIKRVSDKDEDLRKIYEKHSEDVVEKKIKGENNNFNPLLRNLLYGSFRVKTRKMAKEETKYLPSVDIKWIATNLWSDYKIQLENLMIPREIEWFYHKLVTRHSN